MPTQHRLEFRAFDFLQPDEKVPGKSWCIAPDHERVEQESPGEFGMCTSRVNRAATAQPAFPRNVGIVSNRNGL